jgi:hypothetical protein
MYPIGLLQTPGKPAFPFEVILDCCSARAEDGTTMFVILWEFEVKPEERFERVYNPHGDWVRLFLRDPRFRGSQLLRDPSRTHFYFTLDFWIPNPLTKTFGARIAPPTRNWIAPRKLSHGRNAALVPLP